MDSQYFFNLKNSCNNHNASVNLQHCIIVMVKIYHQDKEANMGAQRPYIDTVCRCITIDPGYEGLDFSRTIHHVLLLHTPSHHNFDLQSFVGQRAITQMSRSEEWQCDYLASSLNTGDGRGNVEKTPLFVCFKCGSQCLYFLTICYHSCSLLSSCWHTWN